MKAINLEVSSYLDLISISNITLVSNEDEMIRNKFNKLKSYLYLFGIDNEILKNQVLVILFIWKLCQKII